MNRKRLLRSWGLWGLLSFFLIFVPTLLSSGSGYHCVSTSDALTQITSGNVKKAVQADKEQTLQLELKKPFDEKYSKIYRQSSADASSTIFNDLTAAKKSGKEFRTHVSKENT